MLIMGCDFHTRVSNWDAINFSPFATRWILLGIPSKNPKSPPSHPFCGTN
jgi:hypothetical protein